MADTRVMVVDDSAAMRALLCDLLSNANGVDVCGVAGSAEEARVKLDAVKPDLLLLDLEMPGMSGIDFLAEIMARSPLPVIMLSSRTPPERTTERRVRELGAAHCLAKPAYSSGAEFRKVAGHLGWIMRKAARGELFPYNAANDLTADLDLRPVRPAEDAPSYSNYKSDGRVVVFACGAEGLNTVGNIIRAFPPNCPPTVVVADASRQVMIDWLETICRSAACGVGIADDGLELGPGRVFLAFDDTHHVTIEGGSPPRIRLVDREPVDGVRPSADLLIGSMVREGVGAVAGVLAGRGADGAKGLQILSNTGGTIFLQKPAPFEVRERYDAVRSLGLEVTDLKPDTIADWIIDNTAADVAEAV